MLIENELGNCCLKRKSAAIDSLMLAQTAVSLSAEEAWVRALRLSHYGVAHASFITLRGRSLAFLEAGASIGVTEEN